MMSRAQLSLSDRRNSDRMCSLVESDLEEVTGSAATSCGGSGRKANGCHAGGRTSPDTRHACDANTCAPTQNGDAAAEPARAAQVLCDKCKQRSADVLTQQSHRVCRACLYAAQHARVAQAIRTERLIVDGDRVLLALSGGASSRALLHLLASLRNPDSARKARGLTSFQLSALYVDESMAMGATPAAGAATAAAVRQSCEASGGYSDVELHVARLDDVYASDEQRRNAAAVQQADTSALDARRAKLQTLLKSVTDATGREDLTDALRKQLLLLRAGDLGCNRLVMGDSATRVAVRVVSGTTKGQGYALPGDIQSADAREARMAAVVVYPAKGLMARDLALVCHYERLPLVARRGLGAASRPSINALAAAFVEGLQSNVPSAVSTIQRTAARLQAFRWNSTTSAEDGSCNVDGDPLCPMCRAPMMVAEIGRWQDANRDAAGSALNTPCCRSCSHQLAGVLRTCPVDGERDASNGGPPDQPCLPAFMRMRIEALRTGMLLDP